MCEPNANDEKRPRLCAKEAPRERQRVTVGVERKERHLHELDDEVHDLVLEHGLGVEVGDQEGDVVTLDGLPPEDDEVLGTLGQEAHELLAENGLELVGLLNADGNSA